MAQSNEDREKSRHEALRKEAEKPFTIREFVIGKSDDTYMEDVGKEGIKRQQERMRVKADAESAKYGKKKTAPKNKKIRKRVAGK